MCREIIFTVKPDVIIEIGNNFGGITLALVHILDNMGKGRVIGLDITHENVPAIVKSHPRIQLITGDTHGSFAQVKNLIQGHETVMIIEDSSHTYQNTLNALRTFKGLVTKGSCFIVEDSIVNHGLDFKEFKGRGPYEAIEAFIRKNKGFQIDRTKERFIITWNPKGYLKKL